MTNQKENMSMVTIIVDDDKLAGQDLAGRLETFAEVEVAGVATTGMEGLTMLGKYSPDVIFLDVELPDVSGLDFLDQVERLMHGQCRVVIYTAYGKYVLPAFRKKAFDVLLKPIDDADLDSIMERLANESTMPLHAEELASTTDGVGDKKHDSKYLFFTNTLDFRLIDKRDVGLFQYNHEQRCWEVFVAGSKSPIRMKRNLKSDFFTELTDSFVQVNQRQIINLNYLIEVVDNTCHFYPPFDDMADVKVSRIYRRKLIDKFHSL